MKIRRSVRRPDFSRRRFLRGAGGITLALPALNLFKEDALAQRADVPKRLVVMFTPNGTLREEWVSGGGESNFTLGRILEPLEDIRDRLLVLRGLDNDVSFEGAGDGHQTGMGCMLTARSLPNGMFEGGGPRPPAGLPLGISVDQHIAKNIVGNGNAFDSLPLGIRTMEDVNLFTRMSYSGPAQPVSPYGDPAEVYERISGLAADAMGSDPAPDVDERLDAKRRSAYSYVREEFRRFRDYAGTEDRVKLDQHVDLVDQLETDINRVVNSCDLGNRLGADAREAGNDVPKISDVQRRLGQLALSCDLSRVVTLQYSRAVGMLEYTWLGVERNHHELSHEVDSRDDSYRDVVKIDQWHAEEFGKLVRSIESTEAEDGSSMLDHTVLLWVNELGRGSAHTRRDLSWLMAGNLGGYFDTGRSLDLDGRSTNDLFVTLLRGFGIEDETFGDAEFNEGPIGQLTA